MDRTLLERMVGAVVLVLLFVLFAPIVLDGSADGDSDAVSDVADADGKRTEVIILNAPVNAQPRAAEAEPQPAPRPKPQPKPQLKPQPQLRQAEAPAPEPGFAVQLGSFSERDNADRFAATIRSKGFATFVLRGSAATGAVYRVYSGPAESRQAAGDLAARLQAAGHSGMVTEVGGAGGG